MQIGMTQPVMEPDLCEGRYFVVGFGADRAEPVGGMVV